MITDGQPVQVNYGDPLKKLGSLCPTAVNVVENLAEHQLQAAPYCLFTFTCGEITKKKNEVIS